MSTSATNPPTVATRTPAPPAREKGGYFSHHGVMSPGVRLFRALQFHTKALVISGLFVLPIAILSASAWRSAQQTIDVAATERAGTAVLRSLIPVFENLLATRQATRAGLGGLDTSVDYRTEWAKTDKVIDTLQKDVAASGDPLHLAPAIARLTSAWKATAASTNGVDGQGGTVFGPTTEALTAAMVQLGDKSGLVLDSDMDSLYLANAMVLALPVAAEDVAKLWGFGTVALAKGGLDSKAMTEFHIWAAEAVSRLADAQSFFDRSLNANPSLKTEIDLQPLAAAMAFARQAAATVEKGAGDPKAFYAAGAEGTAATFKVYGSGLTALERLLDARQVDAQRSRDIMLAAASLCLLAAAYFFYAFYLVTRGGLREVKRHLEAMTLGDLTTSPNPWGKDEAASLMLTLREMQSSLRTIVSRVRGSSGSIVTAGSEIAAASVNLSERTENTAANLEKTASSMEQIAATVRQTADNVREAAQVASNNSDSAARGGQVIGEVVSTMQDINASSKRIGDIIGTIDSIAFQTNILALNAAVEAARAGEDGRGFAVVAAEVRSLAQRSAQAAGEIKTLITTSVAMVESGVKVVNGAGSTMQELVVNARRMNDLLTEISTAATEQSSGVGLVGSAVTQLDQMTQQNAALVEQTAAAASSLRDQAISLATEVSSFRL